MPTNLPCHESDADLRELFARRIALLDGAMGTMIQRHPLTEEDFRGDRFKDHGHDLKGNNDLLSITRPDIIKGIHRAYFDAGSDIVETNTFSTTTVSQADYALEGAVREINLAGAKVAREAAEEFMAANPGRRVFVAGSVGPTNRTASMSPDVNNPGYRAVNFDGLVVSYSEQIEALLDGGVDLLLLETVFDTLNLTAAIFACEEVFEKRGMRWPRRPCASVSTSRANRVSSPRSSITSPTTSPYRSGARSRQIRPRRSRPTGCCALTRMKTYAANSRARSVDWFRALMTTRPRACATSPSKSWSVSRATACPVCAPSWLRKSNPRRRYPPTSSSSWRRTSN